ncbi:putative UDP-N-acetylglucosamine--peptide N-acetylglucosaminyltransferase SEC [Diplogelasinospora grovesii]|uniref:protein O-GlcNAc transferase n=1 Tax=Diplogelasinospora grovesii TaxID=303347 RepID=A0AAN6S5K7_9PEZI|nr:putative UDP-N-acetylglucosamine--peptide N-acetylglucosaminyltransferase SEC [Diplogelasinospora grovesii]
MLPLIQTHQMVPNPHLDHRLRPDHDYDYDYFSHHNLQSRHVSHSSNPYHNAAGSFSTPRALPIRSAPQAPLGTQQGQSLHRITTSFIRSHSHEHAGGGAGGEYSLRRKTPSGTIDNGYDGSIAHLPSGPPPLKHMLLDGGLSRIFPTAIVHQHSRAAGSSSAAGMMGGGGNGGSLQQRMPAAGSWPYQTAGTTTTPTGGVMDHVGRESLGAAPASMGWGMGSLSNAGLLGGLDHGAAAALSTGLPQTVSQQQHNFHVLSSLQQQQHQQPMLVPGYQQQPPTPPVYSPGGYAQQAASAAVWRDGGLLHDYRTPGLLAGGYASQNAVVDSAFMPSQSTMNHGLPNALGLGQYAFPFRPPLSSHPLDDGFSRYGQSHAAHHAPNQRLEALSLNSVAGSPATGSVGDALSPAQFKERALQQAHKAYNDLLYYLGHSKRAHHGRHGSSGSRSSSKMVVYPKPPKTLTAASSSSPTPPRPPPIRNTVYPEATASYSQHLAQKEAAAAAAAARAFSFSGQLPTDRPSLDGNGVPHPAAISAEILGHPGGPMHRHSYSSKPHRAYHEMNSPLQAAKKSLEMLTNLCEQSGWKWVDGILLGGCLHYGLEHYEEALEWFKRIISLDESHVEAVSNIAATLYCLNRQDEAEQHWVRAVKMRPSYLEAVEHLVGLLCTNNRSQEAVNTIEFVQRVLRMPGSGTLGDQGRDTASETDSQSTTTTTPTTTTGGRTPSASPDEYVLDFDRADSPEESFAKTATESSTQPGYGSSGYAIPGSENGRMILLIHAKGNMLYGLKDIDRASEAFEEAVLISAGRQIQGVRSLILLIQSVLAPRDPRIPSRSLVRPKSLSIPLLLPPERAKHTAQLVFAASGGQLPGLQYVAEGSHRRSVISTTSNALLSLAKIFQDAMSNGGPTAGLARQAAGVGDILSLYYLSLSLQESPSTANNVGILLASVQQSSPQHVSVPEAAVATTVPGIVPGSGLALALAYYNYGLSLDPKHVHLHTNLGSLLKDIGQLDMAISMYEQAVACDGTFDIALTNLANAVKDRGRINDAILYYKRAVQSNPDFAEAVCGLSTALNSVCDWRGRGGVLLSEGRYDRWHVDEDGMLQDVRSTGRGSGLMKRVVDLVGRQLGESLTWGCGTLQEPSLQQLVAQLRDAGADMTDGSLDLVAELRNWSGRPWEGSRILRLVERSTRAAVRCWYRDRHIRGIYHAAAGYARPRLPASLSIPSAPTVLPFHTFTCPLTAKDIRMISQRNALRISCSTLRSPWIPTTVYEPPPPPNPHLNIGYVSSDFNNHPLAHLMQSVFGFHDGRRAKAFCYAMTASDKSIHRQQIEREAPVFRDVSTWASDKLVDQIVEDGIHILVNLNGYTRGARNEVFAARPAPIQMSFMGFAGTLGAEWCDYLLADTTAVPPSTLRPHRDNLNLGDVFRDEEDAEADDWVYSENIIFCRDTFFCCDHAQSADGSDERGMTWEEEQRRRWRMRKDLFPNLPDDAIILGNFNQLYKIDPTTFRAWLHILSRAPKAVLWLLRFPELGESNLRRTAKLWAGESIANRIIFTDVAPKQQHIARARVCDLFLDTPECNAHTTAADVLWSSTPLLTLPRYEYKMCSRMAASILKGALPKSREGEQAAQELIAADDSEYEKFAVKLANSLSYRLVQSSTNRPHGGEGVEVYGEGSGRLAELRKLLWKSKWTCALFDTRRWVRDLEDAYDEAWRRWVDGEGGDIYLEDL